MCNLNILIRKKGHKTKDLVTPFLSSVTALSYFHNKDGDGIYCNYSDVLLKSKKKLNLMVLKDDIEQSEFIITHQRYTTSGVSEKYTQPFKKEEFVFAHNGVVSEYEDNTNSDSFNMFNKFLVKFNRYFGKSKDRRKAIVKSINNIFYNLSWGTYSIVIYDKVDKKIYYFKNDRTDITFYKNHKYLYITTENDNELFLSMLNEKFVELDIKDFGIYTIDENLNVERVGKIRESRFYTTTDITTDTRTDTTIREGDQTQDEIMEEWKDYNGCGYYDSGFNTPKIKSVKESNYKESFMEYPCSYCSYPTNIQYKKVPVCNYCMGHHEDEIDKQQTKGNTYLNDNYKDYDSYV